MKDKKYYYFSNISKMEVKEIREKNIDRIIIKSNYDSETFCESDFLTNIPPSIMKEVCKIVGEKFNSGDSPFFYVAAAKDYNLYVFEP